MVMSHCVISGTLRYWSPKVKGEAEDAGVASPDSGYRTPCTHHRRKRNHLGASNNDGWIENDPHQIQETRRPWVAVGGYSLQRRALGASAL